MGAASSCQIFQRISDSLAWLVMTSCPVICTIFNYLDDFLILATSQSVCEKALCHFEETANKLGIPLSPHKTVRPTCCLTFLGVGIDTINQIMFVPPEKAAQTLEKLKQFLISKSPKISEWQSILGKLSHLTQIITAGRPFMSSLYSALKGVLSRDKHKRRKINKENREDFEIWVNFLQSLPPSKGFTMLQHSVPDFCIHTDSSTSWGFGCVYGHTWFNGQWPDDSWKALNIAVLELYPIYAAIHMWCTVWEDKSVEVVTDNKALVHVINKSYARDKMLRQLLKPIVQTCLMYNIRLMACHIVGKENKGPDLLSRGHTRQFMEKFPLIHVEPSIIPLAHRPESLVLVK